MTGCDCAAATTLITPEFNWLVFQARPPPGAAGVMLANAHQWLAAGQRERLIRTTADIEMHRAGIVSAEENKRAVGNRTIAGQRHLWAVADDSRSRISIGGREHHLMIPGIHHKAAG